MVTVETIGRIRRAFLVDHKPIRQIVRELRVSRKTVRKAIRGSSTEFRYDRQAQPQPRLGEFVARLDGLLEANSKRPARERLTARRLFELLRAEGYQGAYDSVQRHARAWRRARSQQGAVFIPLWFAPGEAYQFDWSHEVVLGAQSRRNHLIIGGAHAGQLELAHQLDDLMPLHSRPPRPTADRAAGRSGHNRLPARSPAPTPWASLPAEADRHRAVAPGC